MVKKICMCGCNELFNTKFKKAKFKNISHFRKYRNTHFAKRKHKVKLYKKQLVK